MDITLPVVDTLLMTARSSTQFLRVRKISLTPSAYITSVVSFLDSSTGEAIGSFNIPDVRPVGSGTMVLDFSDGGKRASGVKITKGASLQLATTNGVAGRLHVEVDRISI